MSEPTPVHQRLIDDMTLRGFAPLTQKSYIRVVRDCLAHAHKSPRDLQVDDARAYLLHLQRCGAGVGTINGSYVALRFFLRVTLGRGVRCVGIAFVGGIVSVIIAASAPTIGIVLARVPAGHGLLTAPLFFLTRERTR
jgi:hypothetical protein